MSPNNQPDDHASCPARLRRPPLTTLFVYTPKHTSWLNQIEIWFSILVRKLLRRASFGSVEELKARVLAFIDYFNRTMAKPIRWLYSVEAQPANGTG
jgi:putative transposase